MIKRSFFYFFIFSCVIHSLLILIFLIKYKINIRSLNFFCKDFISYKEEYLNKKTVLNQNDDNNLRGLFFYITEKDNDSMEENHISNKITSNKKSTIYKRDNAVYNSLHNKKYLEFKNTKKVYNENYITKKLDKRNKDNKQINTEIEQYLIDVKNVISKNLKQINSYHGKVCNINIKIDHYGNIVNTRIVSGDQNLCKIAIKSIKKAEIPRPKNNLIYKVFKNISLEFKP